MPASYEDAGQKQCSSGILRGANDEERHTRFMTDMIDRASEEQVANQPMTVRGHGDQIAIFDARRVQNFRRWIAQGEFRVNGHAFRAQLSCNLIKVLTVFFHLLGFSQTEAVVIARGPTVGDMDKEK